MHVRLPEMPHVVVDLSTLPSSLDLPSNATILVSLFFALFLLLLVHAAYLLLRENIFRTKQHFEQKKTLSPVAQEQGNSTVKEPPSPSSPPSPSLLSKADKSKVERVRVTASALEQQRVRMPTIAPGKWTWSAWFKWDNTLPMSFSMPRNDLMKSSAGVHVPPMRMATPPRATQEVTQHHLRVPQPQRAESWQQFRRAGPAFETPPPALYQTEVPASMAKIIMSRHTYRRPTLRPPPRSPSPVSQVRQPPAIV